RLLLYGDRHALHSFPTRRSSDLTLINPMGLHARPAAALAGELGAMDVDIEINGVDAQSVMMLMTLGAGQGTELNVAATGPDAQRSEEHTSELQSRENLVCRLLLE